MEQCGWKILDEDGAKKLGIKLIKSEDGEYMMVDMAYIPKGLTIEEYIDMIQKNKIVLNLGINEISEC